MIQQKVRKKRHALMLIFSTVSQKLQTQRERCNYILRRRCGQSLAKLKCESRTSLRGKYNVSDSQAILRDNNPGFFLSLFVNFFAKIKAFALIKLFL